MKSRTSIKTKVREGYNSIGSDYAATRVRSWPAGAGVSDWLARNVQDGMRVLDIGCGAGPLVEFLHQTGKNIEYIGLDNSSALLDEARARFGAKYHNITCTWQEVDMDDLANIKDLSADFDIICLIASLHHIPSSSARSQVLKQVSNLLKPNGYICLTNWYIWTNKFWQKYKLYTQAILHPWRVLVQHDVFIPWKNKSGQIMTQRYIHGFAMNEVSEMLKNLNFQIIKNGIYSKHDKPTVAKSIYTIARKL